MEDQDRNLPLINGILVPQARHIPGPLPAGCKSEIQIWTSKCTLCSLRIDENELIVFPYGFGSAGQESEKYEKTWSELDAGRVATEKIQQSEPRTNPSLQQYYGRNEQGFLRYESAIGLMDSFLQTYTKDEFPESLRYVWAWQLLSAIKFLHDEKGAFHNRIGIENVWLKHDISLMLCDLSCVTSAVEDENIQRPLRDPDDNCRLEVNGHDFGHRYIDLYAFGSMFYIMLIGSRFGKEPISPKNQSDILLELLEAPRAIKEIILKCWKSEYESASEIMDDLRPAMEDLGITFVIHNSHIGPDWPYMVMNLPDGRLDISVPDLSPFNINGIQVPYHMACPNIPPPPGFKGLLQHWVGASSFCCLDTEGTELIVFSKLYLDQFNPYCLSPDSDEEELEMSGLMKGKNMMERIQSDDPRTHPSLQKFYGVASKWSLRFEPAIGVLFLFIAMYEKKEIAFSVRCKWAWQLLSAIKFLHVEKGLIHNQIRPDNIWINSDLNLLLCDLSEATEPIQEKNHRGFLGIADPSCYVRVNDVDYGVPNVDIFAFGSMFYFMLVVGKTGSSEGVNPFQDHIFPTNELEPLFLEIPDGEVREILRKCWELKYENAEEVMVDFEKAINERSVGSVSANDDADAAMSELVRKFQQSL